MSSTDSFPKILSIGLATPENRFSQLEIAELLGVKSSKSLRFFQHNHIKTRHLILPKSLSLNTPFKEETPAQLREKFLSNAILLIEKALDEALKKSDLQKKEIDFIVCVTSTGFNVPGLSALVIEKLKLNKNCQRIDIVGMGCNAGLNGLQTVTNWCKGNPDKMGVLICCELCSCIYSVDDSENTAIVNSLFGDGVVACIVKNSEKKDKAAIIDFSSHLIPESLPFLRFNWHEKNNRYSFFVDKKTPERLAEEIETPLYELLKKHKLEFIDIKHWVVHSGGSAILDAIEAKMKLDKTAFRHTRTVLETLGNISSGSFLFSYQKLLEENIVKPGEYGIMVTMGPGLTVEMALIKW